ncbi:Inversin [Penicillium subrubescens]|uniref:Inversin n=1 Tax=Penicillium subrubescens TaxID=1316194 RepID=A0A1Q5UQ33_9EURO|nr:Inversin [Penicillium subrubescens]
MAESMVKLLLENGQVDLNPRASDGHTPLSQAASRGHESVVKRLLVTGRVDVDMRGFNKHFTPLLWAAYRGQDSVVKLLLESRRVDIDSRDYDGYTPLSQATLGGHESVVNYHSRLVEWIST